MSPAKYILFVVILLLSETMLRARSRSIFSNPKFKEKLGFKTEKMTHFHFYIHDIVRGHNIADINVAQQPATNTTMMDAEAFFGRVDVVDIPLRVSPEMSSKRIGSMQGIITAVSTAEQLTYSMVINFVFTEGENNGSTLATHGRNQATMKTREVAILGGSGIFRFARGYALTSTYFPFDTKAGLAIYEYDLYALHY